MPNATNTRFSGKGKPPRRYEDLRKAMLKAKVRSFDIAAAIGCSKVYVSHCLTGKSELRLSEAYAILNMIGASPSDLPKYFPPDGKSDAINKA